MGRNLSIFLLLLMTGSTVIRAQNFEDRWSGFFSFVSVRDIKQGNDKVYAASENAVFSYDLSTNQIETLTTVNGLDGATITTLHYSSSFDLLVIGYDNGLMEVVIEDNDDVLKVVDILEKPTIPPNEKRINDFNEYNGFLYIAADFGISVYNLSRLEFDDSYFIVEGGSRVKVYQTAVVEPHIYAATKTGLRQALVDENNLIDFSRWEVLRGGIWKGVSELGGVLIGVRDNNRVFEYEEESGFVPLETINSDVVDFDGDTDRLAITTEQEVYAYGPGYIPLGQVTGIPGLEYSFQSGLAIGNIFYVGTEEQGMFRLPFGSVSPEVILPDGPILNRPFAIDASPGQLWVVFGEVDVFFNPFPLNRRGISNLREGSWTNLEVESVFNANDLVNVAINPANPNEVYLTSFQKGLVKIDDQTPTVLYDESNSPLEIPGDDEATGIRLFGMDFDREGNLWFNQSRTNEGLIRLSPGGQFSQVDISAIIDGESQLALTDLAVNRQGFVFFGTAQSGLIGYDPSTDRFNRIEEGVGSGNLPSVNIRALAFDNNNRLWIGTIEGLRVLFNVNGFFEEGEDVEAQEIVFLEDGVAQELLFGQSITDIEVDGSNNKWISTATSGVFYVSANGQETLLRFTKDNSPLPSDNVQDIAIDEFSGRVYFATLRGLVAYDGTSTAPRDNLDNVYAYPNPVRPGFTGNVTIDGLTRNANVKITDIEGNLVFETTSEGGSVLWDTTAFGSYRVASGVYLVMITTEDNLETKVAKIMVVR